MSSDKDEVSSDELETLGAGEGDDILLCDDKLSLEILSFDIVKGAESTSASGGWVETDIMRWEPGTTTSYSCAPERMLSRICRFSGFDSTDKTNDLVFLCKFSISCCNSWFFRSNSAVFMVISSKPVWRKTSAVLKNRFRLDIYDSFNRVATSVSDDVGLSNLARFTTSSCSVSELVFGDDNESESLSLLELLGVCGVLHGLCDRGLPVLASDNCLLIPCWLLGDSTDPFTTMGSVSQMLVANISTTSGTPTPILDVWGSLVMSKGFAGTSWEVMSTKTHTHTYSRPSAPVRAGGSGACVACGRKLTPIVAHWLE